MRQPKNDIRLTIVAIATAAIATSANADIVNNGSFEQPNISGSPFSFFLPVYAGETTIVGWSVEAPSAAQGVDIVSTVTGITQLAYSGQQAIDMSGSPGRGSIYQDLFTTAGQSYQLQCATSTNNGPSLNSLSVSWAGTLIDTLSPPQSTELKRSRVII